MTTIFQPAWSVLDATIAHPFAGVVLAAAAMLLVARPGRSSYRA